MICQTPMRPPIFRSFLSAAGAAVACVASSCIHTPDIDPRPETWAQALQVDALPNLHQVSPTLFRCAQPDDDGYQVAHGLGIKTVVNLRPGEHEGDQPEPSVVRIPVITHDPDYEQARRFFEVVDDPSNRPVLLHCYHGADRTGAFTALYRINRQGWSEEEAIREMTGGDFNFHRMHKHLIDWVREAPAF